MRLLTTTGSVLTVSLLLGISGVGVAQRSESERAYVLVEQARASPCFLAPSRPGPRAPLDVGVIAAAAEGDGAAMQRIAGAYLADRGDPRETLGWLERAAVAGAASAAADAGAMYAAGRGAAQNFETAVEWWRFGAARGDRRAMACLSAALLIGRGVGQDTLAAARWAVAREGSGGGPSLLAPTVVDFERALPTAMMLEARRPVRAAAVETPVVLVQAPAATRALPAFQPAADRSPIGSIQAPMPRGPETTTSFGSGVVVGSPDVVLTSNHVVQGCSSIEVHAGLARHAGVISRAGLAAPDLALLTVPGLSRAPIPAAPSVRPGAQVMLLGFPRTNLDRLRPSVSVGHVSGFGTGEDDWKMQFTAPAAEGNSGGPIIDRRGQIVGLAYAITDLRVELREGLSPAQNANFAVRPEKIMQFLTDHSILSGPPSAMERDLSDIAELVERSVVKVVCHRPAPPATPAAVRASR